eukprot:CAMPEP_0185279474 /NCGR_PEP_ID=MMETSP1359-20130426/63641_1 /TAXON_ID=552665 /ORGANISM="Bigelowiella longifila, Strain CCMP242" /LENGTH=49 /DNA_ID=CAMNT_0027874361 /DNA_START=797 /DNA_END=946 /DNA_ORIENTATION=-
MTAPRIPETAVVTAVDPIPMVRQVSPAFDMNFTGATHSKSSNATHSLTP